MIVHIDCDEWYPVYYRVEGSYIPKGSSPVDVPEGTLLRWEAAFAAFDLVQDEMSSLWRAEIEKGREARRERSR